jgi:hypothetical protein
MTFDPTDRIILGGTFASQLAFPGTPPLTGDFLDIFLAKLPR